MLLKHTSTNWTAHSTISTWTINSEPQTQSVVVENKVKMANSYISNKSLISLRKEKIKFYFEIILKKAFVSCFSSFGPCLHWDNKHTEYIQTMQYACHLTALYLNKAYWIRLCVLWVLLAAVVLSLLPFWFAVPLFLNLSTTQWASNNIRWKISIYMWQKHRDKHSLRTGLDM